MVAVLRATLPLIFWLFSRVLPVGIPFGLGIASKFSTAKTNLACKFDSGYLPQNFPRALP
jgi:peptidoglycan/xylan/chitin deacetylase (PgdA/CDA1 family)